MSRNFSRIDVHDGMIYDEYGSVIGTMIDGVSPKYSRSIACGSEILDSVLDFIKDVENGSLKPKTTVNNFKRILDKYDTL